MIDIILCIVAVVLISWLYVSLRRRRRLASNAINVDSASLPRAVRRRAMRQAWKDYRRKTGRKVTLGQAVRAREAA